MQHESLLGWHFVGETLRDGRPIPPDGEWLMHDGPIVPCESGLHMSVDPFDALQFAPSANLCRVELDGDIVAHGDPVDKHVGRRRRIIQRLDVSRLLRRFAADQALAVAHLWDMPDTVRQYLETLDERLYPPPWSVSPSSRPGGAGTAAMAATGALFVTFSPDRVRYAIDATLDGIASDAAVSSTDSDQPYPLWKKSWNLAWNDAWNSARKSAMAGFNRRVYSAFSLSD